MRSFNHYWAIKMNEPTLSLQSRPLVVKLNNSFFLIIRDTMYLHDKFLQECETENVKMINQQLQKSSMVVLNYLYPFQTMYIFQKAYNSSEALGSERA